MNDELMDIVSELVRRERYAQEEKHGHKNKHIKALSHKPLVLLMEELGEAAQTLDNYDNETDPDLRRALVSHYKEELIQVAALANQAIERLVEQEGV